MAGTIDAHEIVRSFIEEGESIKSIARRYGVRGTKISGILVAAGVRQPGDKGYRYRLRPEAEAEVARRYAQHESPAKIGLDFEIPAGTVRKIARRHGLAINPRGQQYREFSDADIAEMARLWEQEGLSQDAIALRFSTHQTIVSRVLRRAGYRPQPRRAQGARHGNWKGGRARHGDGYVWVRVSETDSLACMRNRAGYVLEHRLVMARFLGRPLTAHETVHHINDKDRADNRLENLQLRQGRHGKGAVFVCGDCGSHNLIARPLADEGNERVTTTTTSYTES